MKPEHRIRSIVLMAISVVGILLVSFYSGTFSLFVQGYGANLFFGFGMYFLLQLFKIPDIDRPTTNAVYAAGVLRCAGNGPIHRSQPRACSTHGISLRMEAGYLLAMGVDYLLSDENLKS